MTTTNPSNIAVGDIVVDRTRKPDDQKTRMKVDGFARDAFNNLYVALSDSKTGKVLCALRAAQVKRAKIAPENKPQTFLERVADPARAPLGGAFIASIVHTAANNERTADDVYDLWREYSDECANADRSPVFREFCSWGKLAGAGPLS